MQILESALLFVVYRDLWWCRENRVHNNLFYLFTTYSGNKQFLSEDDQTDINLSLNMFVEDS